MVKFVDYRRSLKRPSQRLRKDPTPAERKLWYECLAELPEKFTRQKPLGSYIADFYCALKLLVIEVDGDSQFDSAGQENDARRTAALEKLGLRILRFTNLEVMQEFEAVCERIRASLRSP